MGFFLRVYLKEKNRKNRNNIKTTCMYRGKETQRKEPRCLTAPRRPSQVRASNAARAHCHGSREGEEHVYNLVSFFRQLSACRTSCAINSLVLRTEPRPCFQLEAAEPILRLCPKVTPSFRILRRLNNNTLITVPFLFLLSIFHIVFLSALYPCSFKGD